MNEPKTFKIIINNKLVHVQVHFLKIKLVHVKFTQYDCVLFHHWIVNNEYLIFNTYCNTQLMY